MRAIKVLLFVALALPLLGLTGCEAFLCGISDGAFGFCNGLVLEPL